MMRIKIFGREYEFVTKKETDSFSCIDCDFWSEARGGCMAKLLRVKDRLCDSRLGIWKEVHEQINLNRCPKCGREPVYMEMYAGVFFGGWRVECLACRLHTGCCKTKDDAIAKWNKMTKGENEMKQLKRSECAVLSLVLKSKWYDMISSGEKKEEYRDRGTWDKRITKWLRRFIQNPEITNLVIAFQRGYRKPSMWFELNGLCSEKGIRTKHPEWGEPETPHYVISLSERVELVD